MTEKEQLEYLKSISTKVDKFVRLRMEYLHKKGIVEAKDVPKPKKGE